jgi:hypothetical protein
MFPLQRNKSVVTVYTYKYTYSYIQTDKCRSNWCNKYKHVPWLWEEVNEDPAVVSSAVLFPKLKMKLKGRCFKTVSDIEGEMWAVLNSTEENDSRSAFGAWKKNDRITACVPKETTPKEMAAKIESLRPAFIFLPSLGTFWYTSNTYRKCQKNTYYNVDPPILASLHNQRITQMCWNFTVSNNVINDLINFP